MIPLDLLMVLVVAAAIAISAIAIFAMTVRGARVSVLPAGSSFLSGAVRDAEACQTRAGAYAVFDAALASAPADAVWRDLVPYLSDPTSRYREPLLACMADRGQELSSGPLLWAVGSLLSSEDGRTRRAAALALSGGEHLSRLELRLRIRELPAPAADDVRRTLELAGRTIRP